MATQTAPEDMARTAVVIVHSVGEQRPMDTLVDAVKTMLRPVCADGELKWDYYSRPAVTADSYEARRFLARPLSSAPTEIEFYEHHWPFLMTGGRLLRSDGPLLGLGRTWRSYALKPSMPMPARDEEPGQYS